MKTLLKVVVGLVVLLALAVGGALAYFTAETNAKLSKKWDITPVDVPVPWPLDDAELEALKAKRRAELNSPPPADPAAPAAPAPAPADPEKAAPTPVADADLLAGIDLEKLALEKAVARGMRLVNVRLGCTECHGADFGGKVIMSNGAMGTWVGPNITKGGNTKGWVGRDWVRILRHGLMSNGTAATMPAMDYQGLSDREISDIAAYVSSFPAVEREAPKGEAGPIFRMLVATGKFPIAAYVVDHKAAHEKLPPDETVASAALGKHIAGVCVGCHGLNLSGGERPGLDPAWGLPKNLTSHADGLGPWTYDEFKASMREGKKRGGGTVNTAMPWPMLKQLTDVELRSLFDYLKSVPPLPTGSP